MSLIDEGERVAEVFNIVLLRGHLLSDRQFRFEPGSIRGWVILNNYM